MNCKELAENLGIEEEEYIELLELFVETTASNLDRLQSGLVAGDSGAVSEAAHTIKGASANLGLMEIAESAKGIEERARQNNLEGAGDAAEIIRGACEQLVAELSAV
jgi:HPt (histidine-containing phosphotransfer) domain-containing protein